MLKVKAYSIDRLTVYNEKKKRDEVAKKLTLVGDIEETETFDVSISKTTEGGLWVRTESTQEDIQTGENTVTAKFLKKFGIKSEKDLAPREYPLVLQPSDEDPNAKFYVIDLS